MTTNGPCRSFSFLESMASRMYCRRLKPNGSSPLVRYARVSVIEALGVVAMHLGHVERQRAIHEERDVGNALFVDKLVEQQHELLRAPHGERGHDDASAAARGAVDHVGQLVDHVLHAACAAGRRTCSPGSGSRPAASCSGSRMIGRFGRPTSPE